MEDPGTWDLLTASLAVLDLQQPSAAWAFLVVQGLVRDSPGDRDAFAAIVRREVERGPITGPTVASRVAELLARAEIALPAGRIPDPGAATAEERMTLVTQWNRSSPLPVRSPSSPGINVNVLAPKDGGPQMIRATNLIALIVYVATVPAGVFFYFTGPDMGYPATTVGIIAGAFALVGLALSPQVAWRGASDGGTPREVLPAKTSWAVLVSFLVVMVLVAAYLVFNDV